MWPTKFFSCLTLAAATFAAAAALPPAPAEAFPQPSIYPVAWEFDFSYDEPERIVVEIPGRSRPVAFWYMTYSVTNNTDRERPLLPAFEMMTRDGQVIRSDRGVSPVVFDRIKQAERDPILEDALGVTNGPLLLGEDQQRHGVAIWREPEPEMGTFKIYISGLSGETATVESADGDPITGEDGRPILLFKTKELTYRLIGDDQYPGSDRLEKVDESWVMR